MTMTGADWGGGGRVTALTCDHDRCQLGGGGGEGGESNCPHMCPWQMAGAD